MAVENGVHINGDVNLDALPNEDQIISPYATGPVTLRIGPNGSTYTVLQGLAFQYPGLKARANTTLPDAPIDLPEVDEDVAHTLAHFIFTERYQPLVLSGIPDGARAAAEFKRSVLTYCAARLCGIGKLEDVTKRKMEHFGILISMFDIQKVVQDVSSKLPPNEVWFPEHLTSWIKASLVGNESLLHDDRLVEVIGKSPLFDKAMFRSVREMYSEKAAEAKQLSSHLAARKYDSAVPSLNGDYAPPGEQTFQDNATKDIGNLALPRSTNIEGVASPSSIIQAGDLVNSEPLKVSLLNGKEDDLARAENSAKTTDSERDGTGAKKKKNKKKKAKTVTEVQV